MLIKREGKKLTNRNDIRYIDVDRSIGEVSSHVLCRTFINRSFRHGILFFLVLAGNSHYQRKIVFKVA